MTKIRSRIGLTSLALVFLFVVVVCAYLLKNSKGEKSTASPGKVTQHANAVRKKTDTGHKGQGSIAQRTQETGTSKGDAASERERVADLLRQCTEIRYHPSSEGVASLATLLDHENKTVVTRAIETLGVIAKDPDYSEMVLKILKQRAGDRHFLQHGLALLTATRIGKGEMLPVISEYIEGNQGNAPARYQDYAYALKALSYIATPECLAYVQSLLARDLDGRTRGYCFMTLAKIDTPEAVAILEENAFSAKKEDQLTSVMALSTLNRPEVNASLAKGIQENRFDETTILTLTDSPSARDIFGQLMTSNETSKEMKIKLMENLSQYAETRSGDVRESMTAAIAPLLEAEDTEIRKSAVRAIGRVADESAPDLLLPQLYSDSPDIREEAFFAYLGHTTPSNYSPLRDFLWDPNENVRRSAMLLLERFAGSSDRETLEKAANSEDPFIREHAKKLLNGLS
jgi:HEAT repeat protein